MKKHRPYSSLSALLNGEIGLAFFRIGGDWSLILPNLHHLLAFGNPNL